MKQNLELLMDMDMDIDMDTGPILDMVTMMKKTIKLSPKSGIILVKSNVANNIST